MKRTTISLPDDLAAALEREARRRRVPVSQVAREAIEAKLGLDETAQAKFLEIVGLWQSDGSHPTAADLEEWLDQHWARDIEDDAFAGSR